MNNAWQDFHNALDRRAERGAQVRFWLRDDDATSNTPELRRLASWVERIDAEVLLALVPSAADITLAQMLAATPRFVGAVHGWAHRNHAPPEEKKQELGAHRPLAAIRQELDAALKQTQELCGECALPVLVPPWNRIATDVVQTLPELGFSGLSTFSDAFTSSAPPGLLVHNSHVDIIDWRGTRGGRILSDLIEDLVSAVAEHAPGDQPIGILTHHLVHDEAAWSFLDELGQSVQQHPAAVWVSPRSVFCA